MYHRIFLCGRLGVSDLWGPYKTVTLPGVEWHWLSSGLLGGLV